MVTRISSTCFIPQCKSGYKSERKKRENDKNRKKISFFGVPKNDEALLKIWQRKIPRDGFKVTDRVCEIHFKQDDIMRFFETKLKDGTIHRIERSVPRLKPGAVPCIFPNLPKYLSFEVKRRKPPKERSRIQIQKRKKRSHSPKPVLDCDAPVVSNDFDALDVINVCDTPDVSYDLDSFEISNYLDSSNVEDYDFLKLLADLEIIMNNWPEWLCNRTSIKGEDVVFMIHIDATEKLPDKLIRIESNLDVLGFLCGNEKVQLPSSKITNSVDVYYAMKFMSEYKK